MFLQYLLNAEALVTKSTHGPSVHLDLVPREKFLKAGYIYISCVFIALFIEEVIVFSDQTITTLEFIVIFLITASLGPCYNILHDISILSFLQSKVFMAPILGTRSLDLVLQQLMVRTITSCLLSLLCSCPKIVAHGIAVSLPCLCRCNKNLPMEVHHTYPNLNIEKQRLASQWNYYNNLRIFA